MATQDSARTSARDLWYLFSATSDATVVDSDQPGRYDVSVIFGGLNVEELQTVATIAFRSHGFLNLTADDVTTLAAISRMEEFRREAVRLIPQRALYSLPKSDLRHVSATTAD